MWEVAPVSHFQGSEFVPGEGVIMEFPANSLTMSAIGEAATFAFDLFLLLFLHCFFVCSLAADCAARESSQASSTWPGLEQKVQVVVDGGDDDDDTETRAAYLLPDNNPVVCGPAAV